MNKIEFIIIKCYFVFILYLVLFQNAQLQNCVFIK